MALRTRAEIAKQKENERIAKIPAMRARRATYMRRYRKRRRH
jgi:hypothetical protein